MLIFNNGQRSGYEEIVSYVPKFLTEIKEMDAIYHFAGWTLDVMAADLEKIISMQFIINMNDETLERFEKFLEIKTDSTMSIEERKIIAAAAFNNYGKMSKTRICEIVNSLAGCECDVVLKNSVLIINMSFKNNPARYMSSIRKFLRKSVPAHIEILYSGRIDMSIIFFWINRQVLNRICIKLKLFISSHGTGLNLDGSFNLDGMTYLDGKGLVYGKVINRIDIKNITSPLNVLLNTKKNLYFLNGSICLNGSNLLNSYEQKEDL